MGWKRVDGIATALLFLMALVESLDKGFSTLKLGSSIHTRLEVSSLQFDRATNAKGRRQ